MSDLTQYVLHLAGPMEILIW